MEHIREVRAIFVRTAYFKGMEHIRDERAVLMRAPGLEDGCLHGKKTLKLIRRKRVLISKLTSLTS